MGLEGTASLLYSADHATEGCQIPVLPPEMEDMAGNADESGSVLSGPGSLTQASERRLRLANRHPEEVPILGPELAVGPPVGDEDNRVAVDGRVGHVADWGSLEDGPEGCEGIARLRRLVPRQESEVREGRVGCHFQSEPFEPEA